MPDPALLHRIEIVIQSLHEPDVRCYLDEAFKCFTTEAYAAAIVMAWSATIAHLVHEANKIGLEVFQYAFSKEYPERKKIPGKPEELVGDDDKAFVQVCNQMRCLRVASEDLHRFRVRRNESAHPNNNPADEHDAERFLRLCLTVVIRPAENVCILDNTLLVEYALDRGHSAATIVSLVHPSYQVSAATKVMEAYLNNSGPEYDGLVSVWYRVWDLLTETDRNRLWRKLAIEVVRALKGRNEFRSCEEVARFIVWPAPSQKHLYRDFIARQYIHELKRKVQDGIFSSEDKEFALWLYNKLPEGFQRQVVHLCTRWLVDRVKRGDFNGADLDFNAWLKGQSAPDQQTRFQVIRDAIVRRY